MRNTSFVVEDGCFATAHHGLQLLQLVGLALQDLDQVGLLELQEVSLGQLLKVGLVEGVIVGRMLGWHRREQVVLREEVDRLTGGFILGCEHVMLGFLIQTLISRELATIVLLECDILLIRLLGHL